MNPIRRSVIYTGLLSVYLCLTPYPGHAQAPAEPTFEVVSIHPSRPGTPWGYQDTPRRMSLTGANARTFIADAYDKDLAEVVGGPAWINSDQYDVTATWGDSVAAKLAPLSPKDRMNQVFLMLRPVMKQRFGLTLHHETRQVPSYALVLAKRGPKFAPAPPPANEAEARAVGAKYDGHQWTVNREPMTFLALQLSRISEVGRNVIDHTGLKGDYRFNFIVPSKTDSEESVFTTLKEQLGLTLKPTKAPVDFLVIDHIDRPSEN